MIYPESQPTFTVVLLGNADEAQIQNVLGIAEQVQHIFHFKCHPRRFQLSRQRFGLPNGGFDLDAAAVDASKRAKLARPLIFIASEPYGIPEKQQEPDWFFFADLNVRDDISVISTYLWEHLPGPRPLEPYLLFMLAAVILGQRADLHFHSKTRGCLLDFCDEPEEIDKAFASGSLCHAVCEPHVQKKLKEGSARIVEVVAAKKLLNRAVGKKVCFVAIPFRHNLQRIYDRTVCPVLEKLGWTVVRADEIPQPRRITDVIVQAILGCDLVIADLTRRNPNVFYELGFAHAVGCDVLMLTQEKKLPFDVAPERAIIYRPDSGGLRKLTADLRRFARLS